MGVEKNHESNAIHRTTIEKYCPPPLRKCQESNELQNKQVNKTKTITINPLTENKSECTQKTQTLSESSSTASNNSNSSTSINITRPARRERRPDREVYVPRARRSQTSIPNQSNTNISSLPSSYNNRSILDEKLLSSTNNNKKIKDLNHQCHRDCYQQNYHQQQQNKFLRNSTVDDKRHLSSTTSTTNVTNSSCEIVSNKPVITTKSLKINNYCDNKSTDKVANSNNFTEENLLQNQKQLITKNHKTVNSELDNNCDSLDVIQNSINSTNTVTRTHQQYRHQHISDMNKTNKMSNLHVQNHQRENSSALRIEDANKLNNKIDHDALELERASKEINRSNRRIIKQTFKSNVLEIPESNFKNTSGTDSITNINHNDSAKLKTVDPETDDWDSMFDDNGECLDPKLIEELTATVGKVQIDTPKSDYTAYLIKQDILSEEEFPHVLEISNFPVEFKTQDLMMIFSGYKESGFDIKWVDDTHALAVFSSSKIAAEVLAKHHPFVVLKPLAEATFESRSKAKKCSSSLQPYRPRPETCAALARRLVTGALGVRLKTAAQERENEKRVLKEAKERKLLAAKQRDEIWES